MIWKRQRAPSLKTLALGAALLLLAPIAQAAEVEPTASLHTKLGDFSLTIEPALVIPLPNPQKVAHLASKGFGSSIPADTNTTLAGRENNRRVGFVVYFIIVDEGSKYS